MHSFSASHAAHFVFEHSPDSKKSRHASFSSVQGGLSRLAVGDAVMLKSSKIDEKPDVLSDVFGDVGFSVLPSLDVLDGEGAGLAVTELNTSDAVSDGERLDNVLNDSSIEASIVGSRLPLSTGRRVWLSSIDGSIEISLLAVSASVGSSVGASVGSSVGFVSFDSARSAYEKNIIPGSTSCTLPSSIALDMADEYALSSCDAYSLVKSLDELTMGIFIITFTHKSDVCAPTRHSTSITSTEIGSRIAMISSSDCCSVLPSRISPNNRGSSISSVSVKSSSNVSAVTPSPFPFGTKNRNVVSTTTLFWGT